MSAYVVQDFLTGAECSDIVESYRVTDEGQAATIRSVRRSTIAFLSEERTEKLRAKVWKALVRANHLTGDFSISSMEPLQLARYGKGDYYGQHLDIGPGKARMRKLSVSIQLSDAQSYDGGDLVMWGHQVPMERSRGTLVAFPSYLVHEVTPVTRGERYSLVAWASGTTPYR